MSPARSFKDDEGRSKQLFRARYGAENGRLVKTFNWPGMLEIRTSVLVLRLLSSRQQKTRSVVLGTFPFVISFFVTITYWRWVWPYLIQSVSQGWWLALAIVGVAGELASLIVLQIGLMYTFDFLTLSLQVRYSSEAGILELKEVRTGRFRHIIKASIKKELIPMNQGQKEVVLTVAGTRRRLDNFLRPLLARP